MPSWQQAWIRLLIGLCAIYAFCVLFPLLPLSPYLFPVAFELIGFFFFCLLALCIPFWLLFGVLSTLGGVFHKSRRRQHFQGAMVSFATILLIFGSLWINQPIKELAYRRVSKEASTLVDAIKKFESDNGRPPDALMDLIPSYLSTIPRPQMMACGEFEFLVFESPFFEGKSEWYLLGVYLHDDDDKQFPQRPRLVLLYDASGRVTNELLSHMPSEGQYEPFEKHIWKAKPGKRLSMAKRLLQEGSLKGKSREDVWLRLGKPDAVKQTHPTRWQLSTRCSPDIFHEQLVYWPTEAYPLKIGDDPRDTTRAIGNWAHISRPAYD